MAATVKTKAKIFPWRSLMATAFIRLAWTPATFWAATPQELFSAIEQLFIPEHHLFGRDDFTSLMAQFPDNQSR